MPDTLEQLEDRPFSIGGSVTARFRTLGIHDFVGAQHAPGTQLFQHVHASPVLREHVLAEHESARPVEGDQVHLLNVPLRRRLSSPACLRQNAMACATSSPSTTMAADES